MREIAYCPQCKKNVKLKEGLCGCLHCEECGLRIVARCGMIPVGKNDRGETLFGPMPVDGIPLYSSDSVNGVYYF